jgi:hypothetical protein
MTILLAQDWKINVAIYIKIFFCIHDIGGWRDSRTGMDIVKNTKIPCWELSSDSSAVQSTAWSAYQAIQAPTVLQ